MKFSAVGFCQERLTYIPLNTDVPQFDSKPKLSNLDTGPLTTAPNA